MKWAAADESLLREHDPDVRGERDRQARIAATGSFYLSGYPEPITPKVARDREREQTA